MISIKRNLLLGAAFAAVSVHAARADDLTISSKLTSPVATSTAANSSPGNITIAGTGSVEVSNNSNVVTIDSNNSIVNNGLIANTTGSAGFGANIKGGFTGSFVNNGKINVTGDPTSSALLYGIFVNGTGAFTGNISAASGSTLTISGLQANGIAIQTELAGNLTLGGTVQATGQGAIGVLSKSAIDGAFANSGTIATTGGGTSTRSVNVSSGSAVAIGNSVGGGILNAATGTISAVGAVPALFIAPALNSNTAALTIGIVADGANPGFSIVNRGTIANTTEQPSLAPIGVQIGNSSGDLSVASVLTGGFYNSGSIAATSTSDNAKAITVSAISTNATGMVVGIGASVPQLANAASGTIAAKTQGPAGGNAIAIGIQTGASFPSITNMGIISASANATNTNTSFLIAEAIADASGSLTSIVNSGTISAVSTLLTANNQAAIAADLSHATSNITFTDTGIVRGDILFGSGAANQLTIEGTGAIVSGRLGTAGGGRVNIAVSGGGTGGALVTRGAIQAGTLTVGAGGTLNLGIESTTNLILASGDARFAATSHLIVTPLSLPPADATITLIHSDTVLTFDNFTATTAGLQVPFLFTGSLTSNTQNLILNLHRKSASELALTGEAATVFEPAMQAAARDAVFGAAISSLSSNAEMQTVLGQLAPVANNAAKAMVAAVIDPVRNAIGTHQRFLQLTPNAAPTGGIWGQALYGLVNDTHSGGYKGHGTGGVFGAEYATPGTGHFGVAITIYDGTVRDRAPRNAKTDASWALVSPYVGLRAGDAFINGQFTVGVGKLHFTRTVDAGTVTRVAKGSTSEMVAGGGITGGYILHLGGIELAPEAGLHGLYLGDSNYTEKGGGAGVNLSLPARSQSSFGGFVGVSAQAAFEVFGGRLVPQVTAGWSQDLVTSGRSVRAQFVSVPSAAFTISGPQTGKSRMIGSGGLDFDYGPWSLGVNYDAAFGSKASAQTASVSIVRRF